MDLAESQKAGEGVRKPHSEQKEDFRDVLTEAHERACKR